MTPARPSQLPAGALVADARTRQALVALRDLHGAGLTCCAVDSDPASPALVSRWCDRPALVPDFATDEDGYVDALLALCAEHRPNALIPCHDGSIEAIRRRRHDVERAVGLALAPEEPLAAAVDKTRTLAVAAEHGMRVPRGALVTSAGQVAAALQETGLPAVVKPARSWLADGIGRRVVPSVASNPTDAEAAAGALLERGCQVLVQEWLPGERIAVSLLVADGIVWARFAQRAYRTSPPLGGNSAARISIPLPADAAAAAERLVLELGLEGYSEVEFRRDALGRAVLMEINPRLSASVEVAVRAGVPFPRLLYAWASGAPLTRVAGYRLGVRLRWLGGELDWLHHAFARPGEPDVPRAGAAVCGFAADFLRPSGYDYLDRRDPGPALRAVRTALRDARRDRASRVGRSRTGGLDTDVAVIGAGPYGLSLSAHLAGRRVRHELFGQPMGLWRRSMPEGMQLKSEGFASNLSDPLGLHTLQRFCSEHDIDYAPLGVPVRLDTFVRYGDWFRERAVPALRPEQVELVSRVSRGFHLRLDTGDELRARRVVDATGPHRFAHVPEALRRLRSGLVLHSCEVRDPAALAGARVAVVGAGQSALEAATLVREHGGSAIVVARTRRLAWGVRPRGAARTRRARVRDPLSGLGEGLWLTAYANHPLAFHALPSRQRLQVAYRALGPAGAWWLRPRFDPSVDTLLGRSIVSAHEDGGGVRMCLNGGAPASELVVDRVIAATGFRPDPERLGLLLDQATRAALVCDGGMPVLDGWFESSVRGLHFAGYAAAPSFGPVMRFVFGADFAARRLTRRLAPQRAGAVARTASAGPRSASR